MGLKLKVAVVSLDGTKASITFPTKPGRKIGFRDCDKRTKGQKQKKIQVVQSKKARSRGKGSRYLSTLFSLIGPVA